VPRCLQVITISDSNSDGDAPRNCMVWSTVKKPPRRCRWPVLNTKFRVVWTLPNPNPNYNPNPDVHTPCRWHELLLAGCFTSADIAAVEDDASDRSHRALVSSEESSEGDEENALASATAVLNMDAAPDEANAGSPPRPPLQPAATNSPSKAPPSQRGVAQWRWVICPSK